jgi:nucleoside-diphosphate-sugar epimerase
MEAYWASKALSRTLTHTFLAEKNPHFEIINLLPSVVIGPDELATKTSDLLTGTRALAMAPLLGVKSEIPLVGQQVHVNDVARAHVDALKPRVPGNADYILTSDSPDGFKWDDVKAMKTFKNGVSGSEGKLKLDGSMPTMKWKIDVSTTEKTFGWKCKPFEETMKDLIGQYLGLLERESEKPMT